MKFYSTKHQSAEVDFETAILQGLPADNGLYMPEKIEKLDQGFLQNIENRSFGEISFEIAKLLIDGEIADEDLKKIIDQAINFDAPLHQLAEDLFCLELFHGPSMAFKDFGARFMAGVMSHFLKKRNQKVHILVATSGDTGGAVAEGFLGVANIDVTILYPSGKVSDIQEKQLTTLGQNIKAVEIDGSFDDCQALVKQAFLDLDLNTRFQLASANSINIARLIPQAFYYMYTWARLKKDHPKLVFVVPSGNFGNLSAGVIAQKMGMDVEGFVAATNTNDVVPAYLSTGHFRAIVPSKVNISNAMDVGNPSNFPRMLELHDNDFEKFQKNIRGFAYTDTQTRTAIREIHDKYDYLACPHTAIGYLGALDVQKDLKATCVFLGTAHYAKFLPEMTPTLNASLPIPAKLERLLSKQKVAEHLNTDYDSFKEWMIKNFEH